jgi:hypothetical protein
LFITTPKGFNWLYDLYLKGKDVTTTDWQSWQFTTLDGGRVTAQEVEVNKATLSGPLFAQEFLASFEQLRGRIYYNFEIDKHTDDVEDTGAELYVGMDFNVHPMTCVIAVRAADECHVLDAWELPTSNTQEMADELNRVYPNRKIIVCPDPSGKARKTSAPVGQTDFTILRRAGFEVRAPNQAPLVVDRENNTNAMLKDATGRRRLVVHPRAQPLIKSYQGLTYKEDSEGNITGQRDKASPLVHVADAGDYLLWQEFNLVQARQATTQRVRIV